MSDSNTLAITSRRSYINDSSSGTVRVYSWNGTNWGQKGSDIDGEAGDALSMADSNTIAIGAIHNRESGLYTGRVRIFNWNGKSWVQKGRDINGKVANDMLGTSVSMPDSNTVATGAPANDDIGNNAGHVQVYTWNGINWIQKGRDIVPDAAGDGAGWSVSMPNANIIALGARGDDGNGSSAGNVRIYSWDGRKWVQIGSDIDGEAAGDWSGSSVSMGDTKTVAIGAPFNITNGIKSGHVRVYELSPVGTEKIEEYKLGIQVYPNPTSNVVHIYLQKNPGLSKVTISNVQGQELKVEYINGSTENVFDLPQASGMYIIMVQPQGGLPKHFNVLKL